MSILFICDGNIGRSQIAQAYYNFLTNSKDATSAGVDITSPSRYDHPTKEIITVMNEEKIDLSKNKVKTVNKDMVNLADNIYILCKKNKCPEFLLESKKITCWNIKDPFNEDINETRKVRDIIKEKVKEIL